MGFTSMDDWLNKVTNNGYFLRTDWVKQNPSAFVIGRWYDFSLIPGSPPQNSYGELTVNGGPYGSAWNWTGIGSGGWSYVAGLLHTAGTAGTISQPAMTLTNGRYYQLTWTMSWSAGTSMTPTLNGSPATVRSTSNTFTETVGPIGASGGLVFTPTTDVTATITAVSVIEVTSTGTPMSYALTDANPTGAFYHGGNVTPRTKHVINAGVVSPLAVGVPGVAMLVDALLVYPLINANSGAAQTLTTTNTLPRYTTGAGVKPYIVATMAMGTTTPTATSIVYTNQAGTGSRSTPFLVNSNSPASSIISTIVHSGTSTANYGPFMPLAAGDTGVRSVDSITMAASGSASTAALVLAKPLMSIPISTLGVLAERDLINAFPSMPQIVDGACLTWLFMAGNTTSAQTPFYGYVDICYG